MPTGLICCHRPHSVDVSDIKQLDELLISTRAHQLRCTLLSLLFHVQRTHLAHAQGITSRVAELTRPTSWRDSSTTGSGTVAPVSLTECFA